MPLDYKRGLLKMDPFLGIPDFRCSTASDTIENAWQAHFPQPAAGFSG